MGRSHRVPIERKMMMRFQIHCFLYNSVVQGEQLLALATASSPDNTPTAEGNLMRVSGCEGDNFKPEM